MSVIVFYFGWLVLGLFRPTRVSIRTLCGLGIAWVILGWGIPVLATHLYRTQIQRSLTTTFIDVGHGTAVLMELPNGKIMMYDCGSTISSRFATRSVSDVLWHKGISHIDTIVVSHADIDHFNGIPELSDRFSIGTVLLSPTMVQAFVAFSGRTESIAPLKQTLLLVNWHKATLSALTKAFRLSKHSPPSQAPTHANDNSASIVLSVEVQRAENPVTRRSRKRRIGATMLATPAVALRSGNGGPPRKLTQ